MIGTTEPTSIPSVPKRRIVALDLMRGYFILIIASIHLAYYPSLFGAFDGRGQLWVSEAEGFFFISGLLIGIIRRSDIEKLGLKYAIKRMLSRGKKLYLAAIILSFTYLLLAVLSHHLGIAGAKDGFDFEDSALNIIGRVITLKYSYGWADFLGYYAAFMIMAPLVLTLLYKRLWWLVGIGSIALYIMRWAGDYGAFNPLMQWQVYFFFGSIIGYYWHELSDRLISMKQSIRTLTARASIAVSASIMSISAVAVFTPAAYATKAVPTGKIGHLVGNIKNASTNTVYDSLFLHGRIGLLRPLLALIVFAGLFAFVMTFEKQIMKRFGKLLLPFGQNSLYVYIMQSICLFIVPFWVRSSSFWVNSLIELSIIAIIWLSIRYKFLFHIIPR
ncbi:MAG: OpgC domain-containing protein [Candidatus Saccharibacteria bacterium]